MQHVPEVVLKRLNELAGKRFALEIKLSAENQKFKTRQAVYSATHAAHILYIQSQIEQVDNNLWKIIDQYRDQLMAKGSRSFVIMVAKFSFRLNPLRTNITDTKAVMDIARSKRFLRKIARPVRTMKLDSKMFFDVLPTLNDKVKALLAPYIETSGGDETLSMKPNDTYVVVHNGERISPPATPIKRPSKS